MTYQGHCIFAGASIIFARNAELSLNLTHGRWTHLIAGVLIACLIPDMDHPKSFLARRLKFISIPTSKIFGHRGFTHSLIAVFMFFFLLHRNLSSIIPADFMDSMIIGYISHLLADSLTAGGVPLLWPLPWRFRLPILHSQSPIREYIFCISLLAWAIISSF
ncbi:metal-dependent hydrolase [Candidatus Liberibacter sp.]|uniref:metal-dependent hydrolase n=1 Tax=Candidatus Liberibacter sp. TaxID=34022 RepID=UPI0015F37073|nr:metal-dependent hydrolase [Candidatus Liberibacter sp.]MBA5724065.1 metal-dependent hydrolase [Candidatus Liberibacter sp.]